MDLCRICLSTAVEKDISLLKTDQKDDCKGYKEIWYFCLEIQVPNDPKSRKLCLKCFKKVLSFYKFKTLALKNDAYLRAISLECAVKLDHCMKDNVHEVLYNTIPEYEDVDLGIDIKEEPEVKTEDHHEDQSDNELLITIKNEKDETSTNTEDRKENYKSPLPADANMEEINQLEDIIWHEVFEESATLHEAVVKKKRGRPKSKKVIDKVKKQEVCDECGKSVGNLKQHLLQHIPREERRLYQCKDCDKTFTTYGARYRHHKIKHLGIKQHCDTCKKDVVYLKVHNLVMHNKEALPHECMVCNRRFLDVSRLDSHMLQHTQDRPHECDVCQKKFRMKVTMLLHKRQVHDLEKSHLCQFCSKSFFKKSHLQVHLRKHTKEKPYKCPECGRGFSSSTGRRNHMLLHSGEKAHRCHLCDMTFSRASNMRKHILTHTKEKTHPCKYCGLKFGRTDHRKRHEFASHEKYILTPA